MPPKDKKVASAVGMQSITSFFTKVPAAPAVVQQIGEKRGREEEGGIAQRNDALIDVKKAKQAESSPPKDKDSFISTTTTPLREETKDKDAASSGAKTAKGSKSKASFSPQEQAKGRKDKKRLIESSESESESTYLAGQAATKSIVRVGDTVEVMEEGQWLSGKAVRQNISGTWKVLLEHGDEVREVSIPSSSVRIAAEEKSPGAVEGTPAKDGGQKLTQEQMDRIEKNRQEALERRRRREEGGNKGNKAEEGDKMEDGKAKPNHADGKEDRRKRSCKNRKRIVVASSDEEGDDEDDRDGDFKMKDASEDDDEDEIEDEAADSDAAEDVKPKKAKKSTTTSSTPKNNRNVATPAAKDKATPRSATPANVGTARTAPSASPSTWLSAPKGTPTSGIARTSADKQKEKNAKFEASNKKRYQWLEDIKDAQGRRPSDPEYDGRTLYVPKTAYNEFTNFEKQFWDIKKDRFDMVLFFKKGKFYEMFEGDADVGHNKLHLKLTDRTNMRMCGIPEGHFAKYANMLVAMGYKVGRVEQMETLNAREKRTAQTSGPKVCERALCQVLTQGTLTDASMLEGGKSNFLLSLTQDGSNCRLLGICLLESSTGAFHVGQLEDDLMFTHLETLLLRAMPREVIFPKGRLDPMCVKLCKRHLYKPILTALDPGDQYWDADRTCRELNEGDYFENAGPFAKQNGGKVWPEVLRDVDSKDEKAAMSAVGGCVSYLRSLLMDTELVSMKNFSRYEDFDKVGLGNLVIDGQTLANLEILENAGGNGSSDGTLLQHLDKCATPFGKRLFRSWVCSPLQDAAAINVRLDAVERLSHTESGQSTRKVLAKMLKSLVDVERGLSKVHMEAGGRKQGVMFDDTSQRKVKEFVKLLSSLEYMCKIQEVLSEEGDDGSAPLADAIPGVAFPDDYAGTIARFKAKYGGLSDAAENGHVTPEKGAYPRHDEALERVQGIEAQFTDELKRVQKLLNDRGIGYWHPSSGKEQYQIEIPTALCKNLSNEFEVKSKTSKTGRYWTPKVKSLVEKMTDARETLAEERQALSKSMLQDFDSFYPIWIAAATAVATLDCILSLSYSADGAGDGLVCRPTILGGRGPASLVLKESRHPCIKPRAGAAFIPNDIVMGEGKDRACVVTGPNMGGKSTLLRQACVSIIMAQMGAYVPAAECTLSPCDRIFTRIGANDRIIQGQSTFMVELTETSTILQHSTERSLVVLDELGRGTSTHDGYAIAHAVLSDLVERVRPLLLFSTHYHSLTDELRGDAAVTLFHMACLVDDEKKAVTFLHKFTKGATTESYGLHCAQAAGLPRDLLLRAEERKQSMQSTSASVGMRRNALFKALWRLGNDATAADLRGIQDQIRKLK